MKMDVLPKRHPLQIKLDWQAYFQRFMETHGQPIEYKGRLLFPDGWIYSSTDYQGPEWAPPIDPDKLKLLKIDYWTIKGKHAKIELTQLRMNYAGLKGLQQCKSAPLQHYYIVRIDNDKFAKEVAAVDFELIETTMHWLEEDIIEAYQEIFLLNGGKANPTDTKENLNVQSQN